METQKQPTVLKPKKNHVLLGKKQTYGEGKIDNKPTIIIEQKIDKRSLKKVTAKKEGKVEALVKTAQLDELVPIQQDAAKVQHEELKLLQDQLNNDPNKVNLFLQNKYTEGSFNLAVRNGYDNSVARLDAKIAYTYRVFFDQAKGPDGKDLYDGKRTNMKYIISDEIIDKKTGDSYYYHFPLNSLDDKYYRIDYSPENIDKITLKVSGPVGRLGSVNFLANAINKTNNPNMPTEVFNILQEIGIINDRDELTFQPPDHLVEKYFKNFGEQNKRQEAIDYLIKTNLPLASFKNEDKKEKEQPVRVVKIPKKADDEDKKPKVVITDITTYDIMKIDQESTLDASLPTLDALKQFCRQNEDYHLVLVNEEKSPPGVNVRPDIRLPVVIRNPMNEFFIYIFYLKKGTDTKKYPQIFKFGEKAYTEFFSALSKQKLKNVSRLTVIMTFLTERNLHNTLKNPNFTAPSGFTTVTFSKD